MLSSVMCKLRIPRRMHLQWKLIKNHTRIRTKKSFGKKNQTEQLKIKKKQINKSIKQRRNRFESVASLSGELWHN